MHAVIIYYNSAIMAKKRSKDKDASPQRSSKIARVSEKNKDVGKAEETEEIVAPVLAGNAARGSSTRGDKSAEVGSHASPFFDASVSIFSCHGYATVYSKVCFAAGDYKDSR